MRFALVIVAFLFCLPAPAEAPGNRVAVARILTQPLLSPEEVTAAEAKVAANPGDVKLRMRLLEQYRDTAPVPPYDDPAKRAARLNHVLYLVEHDADRVDPSSPLLYVPRRRGPYADPGDYGAVRALLMRLADTNPADSRMALNAARFLFVEDQQEAIDFLQRAVEANASDQRVAANLGFLYAVPILSPDPEDRQRVIAELESSSNPAVLAAAATAIPNLAMRASGGAQADPELFQLAARLMARARALAPNDEALRGPMPMIEYFQEWQGVPIAPRPSEIPPGAPRIRISGDEQKSKLIKAAEPKYPEAAKASGISGNVRFDATIAPDGTVSALTLRSGHPLLVLSATDAVKQWRYQPTLLNGTPVAVMTEIVVSFPSK